MRLIDADALYEKVAEWEAQALHMVEMIMYDEDNAEWKRWSTILTERSAFKFDVADAPTIDAVPVVHGEWTELDNPGQFDFRDTWVRCSNCNYLTTTIWSHSHKYCPCCGAQMDLEEGEEA